VSTDNDQVDDVADTTFVAGPDQDQDGILDAFDVDINGDGIIDAVVSGQQNDLYRNGILPDLDDDFMPDFRDDDVIGAPDTGQPPAGTTGGQTDAGDTTTGTTTSGTTTVGTTTSGTTTNGGTTNGDTTAGDTTAGDTTSGMTTTGGTTNNNGIVETGLSGNACSIGTGPGRDPLFPGMVLIGALVLFTRRFRASRSLK